MKRVAAVVCAVLIITVVFLGLHLWPTLRADQGFEDLVGLVEKYRSFPPPAEIAGVIYEFGDVGSGHVERVVAANLKDEEKSRRWAAMLLLASWFQAHPAELHSREWTEQFRSDIVSGLHSEDYDERYCAVGAMYALPELGAARAELERISQSDSDEPLRALATWVLRQRQQL